MKTIFMIIAFAAAAFFGSYARLGYNGHSHLQSAVLYLFAVTFIVGGVVLGMQTFAH